MKFGASLSSRKQIKRNLLRTRRIVFKERKPELFNRTRRQFSVVFNREYCSVSAVSHRFDRRFEEKRSRTRKQRNSRECWFLIWVRRHNLCLQSSLTKKSVSEFIFSFSLVSFRLWSNDAFEFSTMQNVSFFSLFCFNDHRRKSLEIYLLLADFIVDDSDRNVCGRSICQRKATSLALCFPRFIWKISLIELSRSSSSMSFVPTREIDR